MKLVRTYRIRPPLIKPGGRNHATIRIHFCIYIVILFKPFLSFIIFVCACELRMNRVMEATNKCVQESV